MDILGNFDNVEEAKDCLIRELKRGLYKRGNFVIADREDAYHVIFDNEVFICEVRLGAYVVTNITPLPMMKVSGEVKERLERAEKRRKRAEHLANSLVEKIRSSRITTINEVIEELKRIASDHAYGKSKLSICYHGDSWIMTSSTIIAISDSIEDSRILYCSGNPM